MSRRVAVLKGGWSAEREVSLVSGRECAAALGRAGYDVIEIDLSRDMAALIEALTPAPDVVFNALHGRFGEDGCIQGLLNILGIPYTHSGVVASAVAMDKPQAKRLFASAGIPVAEHQIIDRAAASAGDPLPRPYVIKPLNEGSSVGVHIITEHSNRRLEDSVIWEHSKTVMVERFIPGKELTVAVVGDRPLAVTDITTNRGFYDYDAKYSDGGSRHEIPAQIESNTYNYILGLAVDAHQTLGCRGVSRTDFRFDGKTVFILEVNTQPGMTPTSLVPEQAAFVGISFEALVSWMVENATCDG